MKLYAISDLHIGYERNRQTLLALPAFPQDWLIVAGDIGETEEQFEFTLKHLSERFARLIWTPGNHDLWTISEGTLMGEEKYRRLIALCRQYGVLTPEDEYVVWPGEGPACRIAPIFLLYDYTFHPDDVPQDEVLAWAAEEDVVCADEYFLHPHPYPSREAWCQARLQYTFQRLQSAAAQPEPLILVNHYPLRQDMAKLPRIPRFTPWCGTRQTENWHLRWPVYAVIYGHLHIRTTRYQDGVRFEEVSLGYPQHWKPERTLASYLRPILPPSSDAETIFKYWP